MKEHLQKLLNYIATATCVLMGALPGAGGQIQPQGSLANTNVTAQQQHETHSQLFRGQNLETIPDILAKTSGDIYLRYDQPTGFPMAPLNPPAYPPYPLVAFACTSDAVVIATAQTGESHLTSDQRFVYTDWKFAVEQVLKDNLRSPIAAGSALIVTRSGGKLEMNGRKIYANDVGFKDFKSGGRYLLFLDFIPQTRAYKAKEEKSFSLETKKVVALARDNPYADFEPKDPERLINDTNAAITAQTPGCSGREK
jgi:hypothetical protein